MSEDNKQDKKGLYFFIQRPRFAMVISIFITLLGLISIAGLKLEQYPQIVPVQIAVQASYPGASADVVESSVASLIESQVNGVEDMIYMTSTSQDGSYLLTVYFNVGTDKDIALVNVQNRLSQVEPRLPEDVRRLGVTSKVKVSGAGLMILGMLSHTDKYDKLYAYNYASVYVKDELLRVPGVGEITVYGAGNYSIRIWLDPEKMANLGVSVGEIQSAVAQQNTQVAAGFFGQEPLIDKQKMQITLRTKGRLENPEEFEQIIVRSRPDGSVIRIKDIATVDLGAESYNSIGRVNGKPCAIIQILQLPDANAIDVANKVKKALDTTINPSLPDGLELQVLRDETEFVKESMKEVIKTIFEACFIVVFLTYLFLGSARATLIPFFAIPVSLIGTFAALPMLDMSINTLTLFAMVLAVGTVVDDAIVVIENVERHLHEGKDAIQATQLTMQEVGGALVAMAMVLMAVFVPVAFVPGLSGVMFKQFAVCIAVSIALSAVCALSLSPAIASIVMAGNKIKKINIIQKFDNWFANFTDWYMHLTHKFVYNKKLTVITFIGMCILTLFLFKVVPTGFLPTEDQGVILTQISLPASSSLSRTDDLTKEIENAVKDVEGIRKVMVFGGMSGTNTAFMVFELQDFVDRELNILQKIIRTIKGQPTDISAFAIANRIRGLIAPYREANIYVMMPPAISGLSMNGGFEYQLLSKGDYTPQELEAIANKFMIDANMNNNLSNVYHTYQSNMLQYFVDIDTDKALAQGVSLSEIYTTLASNFGQYYVNDFNKMGRVFRVQLQAKQDARRNPNDLSKIYVKNNMGTMLPIQTMVKLHEIVGATSIARFNQYRSIQMNGEPAEGKSTGAAMKTMEELSVENLPKDVGYAWSGISYQEQQSQGTIGIILAFSLLFVYLFLVALYESWAIPVAVLLIAPVATCGALIFQFITNQAFDIYSQIGMIMLIGLATKQAILIVEFANELHLKEGLSIEEAAMKAARLRFRAVVMTVIAFVVGVIPLLVAHGAGAASRISVGSTVFGGMLAAGIFGTLFVPAFYVCVQSIVENIIGKVKKKEVEEK